MPALITLDVWSDYVCPFCYLELPTLNRLQSEFGRDLSIRWRAFELRPDPVPTLDPHGEYLRSIWARAVYPMAEARRMTLHLPPVQPRSRLAFEAERFARDYGRGPEMHRALFRALFEHGLDIGNVTVLADIGRAVALNAHRLRFALENGDYTEAVLAERREAERLGVTSAPTMLLRRTDDPASPPRRIVGAPPFETLLQAVEDMLETA